jgi:NAD(P)-dependent dehydrogenase (short-subunit alcohol dehydrogenase family)
MTLLQGRTAVVTGALGGQGRAVCHRFCAEGATVIGVDRTDDGTDTLAKEIADLGGKFEFRRVDVGSKTDVDAFAELMRDAHGRVDVLYNNAGIMEAKPTLEVSEQEWDEVQDVNLKSAFLMTTAFVSLMRDRSGSIINVASTGGFKVYDNLASYGAAKAGLIQFTRVIAVEFAPGIRANTICPGMIDTPMARRFATLLPDPDGAWEMMTGQTALKRFGTPDEVANLAVWLASDESSFVTGESITIDGGSALR